MALTGVEPLAGPPEWWAETLTGFIEDGFDTLVFWPVDPSPGQVEVFASGVVPLGVIYRASMNCSARLCARKSRATRTPWPERRRSTPQARRSRLR